MGSLVGGRSCFLMNTIKEEGYAQVSINRLTETCRKVDIQNQSKQADEGEISNRTKVQNPYKLPLNPESIVFINKQDESKLPA